MLVLHKTLETCGGTIQIQPSMKRRLNYYAVVLLYLRLHLLPQNVVFSKHIVQFRLHKKTAAPTTFHGQGASYHLSESVIEWLELITQIDRNNSPMIPIPFSPAISEFPIHLSMRVTTLLEVFPGNLAAGRDQRSKIKPMISE